MRHSCTHMFVRCTTAPAKARTLALLWQIPVIRSLAAAASELYHTLQARIRTFQLTCSPTMCRTASMLSRSLALITKILECHFTMRNILNAHAQFSRFLTPVQV